MTDLERFADLVKRMRAHQDAYFKSRDRITLGQAKRLEHEVDAAVIRILDKAPRMFPGSVD